MRENDLKSLLESVKAGKTDVAAALRQLKELPFTDLGFAKLDSHRSIRKGFPEVVYAPGKTKKQIVSIVNNRLQDEEPIVITRADEGVFETVQKQVPGAVFHEDAGLIVIAKGEPPATTGLVAVVTAGTTDIPVAEEAAIVAGLMGANVERVFDVGVAGAHRLFAHQELLHEARVIVAAAGMEGALPSLIGGIVSCPVIAVPTSVGYGASFGGITALLSMLNSCAPGIAVVNIDNGFGAGYLAGIINRTVDGRP